MPASQVALPVATDKEMLEPEQTVRSQTRQSGEVTRKAFWGLEGSSRGTCMAMRDQSLHSFPVCWSLGQSPAVLIADPDQCKCLVLLFL